MKTWLKFALLAAVVLCPLLASQSHASIVWGNGIVVDQDPSDLSGY